MTKQTLACLLFQMKKQGAPFFLMGDGDIITADEILTRLMGREVEAIEGFNFVTPHAIA